MAETGAGGGDSNMDVTVYAAAGTHEQPGFEELLSPTDVLSPASSLDSMESFESHEELTARLDSDLDPSQEEQIEKLKEFLSEAQGRGDDFVTQSDADAVRGMENMMIGKNAEGGLSARLQSAARVNLEIEKQTAAGYFPSETVYLQEHTLSEVLDEANPVTAFTTTVTVADRSAPAPKASPCKSPRSVDADDALKNELDCLFQERAARFRLE